MQNEARFTNSELALMLFFILLLIICIVIGGLMLAELVFPTKALAQTNQSAQKTLTLKVAPHSVALSWIASSTPGVTYNVFRGSQSNGPYIKIVNVTGTNYTDQPVPSGTYFYVVDAMNSNGKESVYTSEAKAVVP